MGFYWASLGLALLTGVVASLLALSLDRLRTAIQLWRRFRKLAGRYDHYNLANEPCAREGQQAQTTLRYKGNATFEAESQTEHGDWRGRIKIDPTLSDYGSGTFLYSDVSRGSGLIQVIVLGDTRDILVQALAVNFIGSSPGAYLWRKVD